MLNSSHKLMYKANEDGFDNVSKKAEFIDALSGNVCKKAVFNDTVGCAA